jgi:putative transposase
LEASLADYPAGHAAALAPRGLPAVLEVEILRARPGASSAPGTRNDRLDRAASGRYRCDGILNGVARENPLWGAERIRGELLKLNIKVAKQTIQKYMQAVRSKPPTEQSWSTFLRTHGKDIWACDFVPVVTLFFKTIHAFMIVHHDSRRVVHVGVTEHPTDEWIAQQLRDATPFAEKPKYLVCDNDKKYGPLFEWVAQAAGIEVIHTPYEAPRANAICERFVGSLRRECLDHVLVIGELQLIRVLKEYVSYFNPARPHQGIAQQIPAPAVLPLGEANSGMVMAFPVLNGLHHDYRWAAA